jgi:hypothetical protein
VGYLIVKDLLLQKKMLGAAVLYVLVFTFAFQGMGAGQLIAIISAVGYMFVMLGAAWEEKNSSDVLWNSLPVSKRKIVGAKYLSIPLYALIVIIVYWIVSTVLSLLGGPIAAMPLDPVGIVLGVGAVFVAASLYFPVFFAVGYTKSRYWHFILFFGIMILGSMLPALIPEKPAWLDPLVKRLPEVTSDIAGLAIFGVFVALWVGISFVVSLRLYGRREF